MVTPLTEGSIMNVCNSHLKRFFFQRLCKYLVCIKGSEVRNLQITPCSVNNQTHRDCAKVTTMERWPILLGLKVLFFALSKNIWDCARVALLERCLTSEVTVNRGFTNYIKVIQCYITFFLEILYLLINRKANNIGYYAFITVICTPFHRM